MDGGRPCPGIQERNFFLKDSKICLRSWSYLDRQGSHSWCYTTGDCARGRPGSGLHSRTGKMLTSLQGRAQVLLVRGTEGAGSKTSLRLHYFWWKTSSLKSSLDVWLRGKLFSEASSFYLCLISMLSSPANSPWQPWLLLSCSRRCSEQALQEPWQFKCVPSQHKVNKWEVKFSSAPWNVCTEHLRQFK